MEPMPRLPAAPARPRYWSGISTRLVPKMIIDGQRVDAFVFYDGRCGSSIAVAPSRMG